MDAPPEDIWRYRGIWPYLRYVDGLLVNCSGACAAMGIRRASTSNSNRHQLPQRPGATADTERFLGTLLEVEGSALGAFAMASTAGT